jgi:AcrR family transcriptional regulator
MTVDTASPPKALDDPRRCKLLEIALGVFARFGFKKTSMDEVARAANVSRQGLYLHFSTKEALFRSAVQHTLETSLKAVHRQLADTSLALEEKLVGAFDEWVGRYVGSMGPGANDLSEASDTLVGPLLDEHEALFLEAVVKTIRSSGLLAAYKASGLTARQLAETLQATARGLKHGASSRAHFVGGITVAVRAMCAPLR